MGAPNFAKVADAPAYKALIIGALEAATRRVGLLKNTADAEAAFPQGLIMVRGWDGKYAPLKAADINVPGGATAVADEAVGTGDGSKVAFALAHAPVLDGSVTISVAGTEVTEVSVDPGTGKIVFDTAPANTAAVTASYRYYDPTAMFPAGVAAVLEEATTLAATSEGTAQVVLKGEVAADLLSLDGTDWADLATLTREKLNNLLAASGITPCAVKR